MKILYIGAFNNHLDEGLSSISSSFSNHFSTKYEVLSINAIDIIKPVNIYKVFRFRPRIIHYLTGPTIRSFFILSLLKAAFWGKTKTIVSATRPFFGAFSKKLLGLVKPDIILTQSEIWAELFRKAKINTRFLPNGIDLAKYKEYKETDVKKLKNKFGLDIIDEIILHVGHIKDNRNLEILIDIQTKTNFQVVMVGGSSPGKNLSLKSRMENSGVIVIDQYLENIEEIYNCADYYIFPVLGLNKFPKSYNEVGVIDLSLSILEAMACNLPIFSTPCPVLSKIFPKHDGIVYFDGSFDNFVDSFNTGIKGNNKEEVKKLDWNIVFEECNDLYQKVRSK